MMKMKFKPTHLLSVVFTALVYLIGLQGLNAQIINNNSASGSAADGSKTADEYDLTDEQRHESQTYIHGGLNNRKIKEACDKLKDSSACQGRGKTEFLGIDSGMVQAVSKVYSIFGAMIGSGKDSGFTKKTKKLKEGETAKKGDSEKSQDYCAYIPAAGETLAGFTQQMGQQSIQAETLGIETPQKQQLYKASRSHGTRAKTAKMQGTFWGSTAACYGYYMASGKVVIDWKVIAKAAGAGFLTAFWFKEAKQQEDYADQVKQIADELPGRGDCNPHTEKDCYCAQPETQYHPVHCVPELHRKAAAANSFRVPCADKDMKPDASCNCLSTEACFDSEYFSQIKAPGFVQFANSAAGKDFRSLTRGSLNNGTLTAGINSNSANAKKLFGDLASKVKSNPSLDKNGLKASDAFKSLGVPTPLARLLASQKETTQGKKRAISLTSGLSPSGGKLAAHSNSSQRGTGVLRFNRTKSSIGSKKKSSRSSNPFKFKRKKSRRPSGAKTLKFAQRAQRSAQITKNKDRPIFEIISRRYQVSGWKRLEIK